MVAGGGMVGVGGGFVAAVGKLVANAGAKRLVGAPGVGVMPVTVPVLAPTLVTAVPVFGVTLVIALVEGVVRLVPEVKNVPGGPTPTFVTTVCGGAVTPVTALENVGVMPVTTVAPGCPMTSLTALAKVDVTPVTQVAADAEDTSAVLRLPTVSAARSVWCEADANSANRTAARRGTVVCFGLVIRPPSGVSDWP